MRAVRADREQELKQEFVRRTAFRMVRPSILASDLTELACARAGRAHVSARRKTRIPHSMARITGSVVVSNDAVREWVIGIEGPRSRTKRRVQNLDVLETRGRR